MIGQYVARFVGQAPTLDSRRLTKWHRVESTIAGRVVVACREMDHVTSRGRLLQVEPAYVETQVAEEDVCERCT